MPSVLYSPPRPMPSVNEQMRFTLRGISRENGWGMGNRFQMEGLWYPENTPPGSRLLFVSSLGPLRCIWEAESMRWQLISSGDKQKLCGRMSMLGRKWLIWQSKVWATEQAALFTWNRSWKCDSRDYIAWCWEYNQDIWKTAECLRLIGISLMFGKSLNKWRTEQI